MTENNVTKMKVAELMETESAVKAEGNSESASGEKRKGISNSRPKDSFGKTIF